LKKKERKNERKKERKKNGIESVDQEVFCSNYCQIVSFLAFQVESLKIVFLLYFEASSIFNNK